MSKLPGQAATASVGRFDADIKCCSYLPILPNFLVGRILNDHEPDSAAGQRSILARIARGDGVTPLGLGMTASYSRIYRHAAGQLFGKSKAMRCPHVVSSERGAACSIWRHRNAVCTTYFCKHDRGSTGKAVWDALQRLLTRVEQKLELWCALSIRGDLGGLDAAICLDGGTLRPSLAGDPINPASVMWRDWVGREIQFYREAAHIVDSLSWEQIVEIAAIGPELRVVRDAYLAYHDPSVNDYVRLAAIAILPLDDETCVVSSYSKQDMLILPTALVEALFRFDGRTSTDVVIESIKIRDRQDIDIAEVRRLVDFGVLVPLPEFSGTELERSLAPGRRYEAQGFHHT